MEAVNGTGRRRRRVTVGRGLAAMLAIAALLALALAGGASARTVENARMASSEQAFAKAYLKDIVKVDTAATTIGAALEKLAKDSDSQVIAKVEVLAHQWDAAITPILTLKPPAALKALYDQLVGYLRGIGTNLLAMAKTAKAGNLTAFATAVKAVERDSTGYSTTAVALLKKLHG